MRESDASQTRDPRRRMVIELAHGASWPCRMSGATSFMTFKMEAIVRDADRSRGPLASST